MSNLLKAVRSSSVLEKAARFVNARASVSKSKDIRAEAEQFRQNWTGNILGLQRHLRRGSFVFEQQRPVIIPRPNKQPRPIVIAPIRNRIVQRAILEVIKDVPAVGQILAEPTSVGGIEGVDSGIALVQQAIKHGAQWYVRTDIRNFFSAIPRSPINSFVSHATGDFGFSKLFDDALTTTLLNETDLSDEDRALFPDDETGVAQGSALSALAGNILLHDFDRMMQRDDVVCVRYIDDFILLARNRRAAMRAFAVAKDYLSRYRFAVYEPDDGTGKAAEGQIERGFDFLGCRVMPGLVQPSRKARAELVARVEEVLAEGRRTIKRLLVDGGSLPKRGGEAQVIALVDNIVDGWGQAFAFCNGRQYCDALDQVIRRLVDGFHAANVRSAAGLSDRMRMRVAGVRALADVKPRPLEISHRARGMYLNRL